MRARKEKHDMWANIFSLTMLSPVLGNHRSKKRPASRLVRDITVIYFYIENYINDIYLFKKLP